MPEVKAYAPGIYARSEGLVRATRDPDRGRTTAEVVRGRRRSVARWVPRHLAGRDRGVAGTKPGEIPNGAESCVVRVRRASDSRKGPTLRVAVEGSPSWPDTNSAGSQDCVTQVTRRL